MAKTIAGKLIQGIKTAAQLINSAESILPKPTKKQLSPTKKKSKK